MEPKTKLVIPAALVVVALGSGCTTPPTPVADAGTDAPVVADARNFDASCEAGETYDPVANACIPIVV